MEFSRLWRSDKYQGIELLKASFQRFSFSRHWHDELSIGVIEKGAEGLNYRGDSLIIPEQQIVAINPAEVHTGFAGCDSGWTYRMFYFDTQQIASVLDKDPATFLPFISQPVIDDTELYQRLLLLHASFDEPAMDLAQDSLLVLALDVLFQRHGSNHSEPKIQKGDTIKTQKVFEFLSDNWQGNPSLDQLIGLTGLSKYQVIRHFSAQYGITPHQFLLGKKIIQARHLLSQGWSCADAALECGFFDQSHMNRNFKKAYGLTPKQYGRRL